MDHFSSVNNTPKRLTRAALDALAGYAFPGNVRELMNICERLLVMSETEVVDLSDLPVHVAGRPEAGVPEGDDWPESISLHQAVEAVERKLLSRTLDRCRSQAEIAEAVVHSRLKRNAPILHGERFYIDQSGRA